MARKGETRPRWAARSGRIRSSGQNAGSTPAQIRDLDELSRAAYNSAFLGRRWDKRHAGGDRRISYDAVAGAVGGQGDMIVAGSPPTSQPVPDGFRRVERR